MSKHYNVKNEKWIAEKKEKNVLFGLQNGVVAAFTSRG